MKWAWYEWQRLPWNLKLYLSRKADKHKTMTWYGMMCVGRMNGTHASVVRKIRWQPETWSALHHFCHKGSSQRNSNTESCKLHTLVASPCQDRVINHWDKICMFLCRNLRMIQQRWQRIQNSICNICFFRVHQVLQGYILVSFLKLLRVWYWVPNSSFQGDWEETWAPTSNHIIMSYHSKKQFCNVTVSDY